MHRIFLRVFLSTALGIVVSLVLMVYSTHRVFEDQLEATALRQAAGQIFLLEQYLDNASPDEWLVRFDKVREVMNLSLELIPMQEALSKLPERKHAALVRGEVVANFINEDFFRRVGATGAKHASRADQVIYVKELPIEDSLMRKLHALQILIVTLSVLIPIGLWSRSHWRELQALSAVADDFGAGKLSTRAKIGKSAGVYPLAQCMNQMAERIERLIGAHRDLLHSVSHELRTPIARLGFGLELLRKAANDDALEGRICAMEGDVAELNGLVNELLNLAKLDQQQTSSRDRFALGDALHQTLNALEHVFADKQIDVAIPANLGSCSGDQNLIERAVGNLLKNAAKYADRRIALSACRRDDNSVDIVVEDDGPGIPPEQRERVFDPFYRLDRSRDRATGGFGLGLSIAQKAVLLHGGSISVHDSALGGAKFVLTIPTSA